MMAQAGVNPSTAADLLRQAMAQKYVKLFLLCLLVLPSFAGGGKTMHRGTIVPGAKKITCHEDIRMWEDGENFYTPTATS